MLQLETIKPDATGPPGVLSTWRIIIGSYFGSVARVPTKRWTEPRSLIDGGRQPDQLQGVRIVLVVAIERDMWYRTLNVNVCHTEDCEESLTKTCSIPRPFSVSPTPVTTTSTADTDRLQRRTLST